MSKSFDEIIKSEIPTLVDFYALWCGPCKIMRPILEELKTIVGAEATVLKIDVDKSPEMANAYRIHSVPSIILFKNGQIKWRESGVVSVRILTEIIRQYMV